MIFSILVVSELVKRERKVFLAALTSSAIAIALEDKKKQKAKKVKRILFIQY